MLRYRVTGDITRLLVSAPAYPDRADELWKHTCFELFLRPPHAENYVEFNFSPSTQWAVYAFDRYRDGMRAAEDVEAIVISSEAADDTYQLIVAMRAPFLAEHTTWCMGVSAILEETDGRKSYWALRHLASKPDFHHRDCFAAKLGASERS
jgi:hypothetical protein